MLWPHLEHDVEGVRVLNLDGHHCAAELELCLVDLQQKVGTAANLKEFFDKYKGSVLHADHAVVAAHLGDTLVEACMSDSNGHLACEPRKRKTDCEMSMAGPRCSSFDHVSVHALIIA